MEPQRRAARCGSDRPLARRSHQGRNPGNPRGTAPTRASAPPAQPGAHHGGTMTLAPTARAEEDACGFSERAAAVVGTLTAEGVELWRDAADVMFSGPAHALKRETLAALRENKAGVVALLD